MSAEGFRGSPASRLGPDEPGPLRTAVSLGQVTAELFGEARALWLPASRILAVGDLHLGKAATLRQAGLAIPEGGDRDDLARLTRLVDRLRPRQLILLGDLIHASAGLTDFLIEETIRALRAWEHSGLERAILVRGNHDRAEWPAEVGLTVVKHLDLDALEWIHDPAAADAGRWSVAAHLHPLARIDAGRGRRVTLPCFWLRQQDRTLILPTFGGSLGGRCWPPAPGDRQWLCVPGIERARKLS